MRHTKHHLRLMAMLLAVSAVPGVAAPLQESHPSEQEGVPIDVPFCEIVRKPAEYNGKAVKTRAIFAVGPEASGLYEPDCRSEEYWTWAETPTPKEWDPDVLATLNKLLRSDRRAYVQVVGRFDGPKKHAPCPAGMTCWSTRGDYGHLGLYRFRFVITAMEEAEQVPADTPWPTIKEHAKPFPMAAPEQVPDKLVPP